jgi:hypothetical protein
MTHLDENFYLQHKHDDAYGIEEFRGVPRDRNLGGAGEVKEPTDPSNGIGYTDDNKQHPFYGSLENRMSAFSK